MSFIAKIDASRFKLIDDAILYPEIQDVKIILCGPAHNNVSEDDWWRNVHRNSDLTQGKLKAAADPVLDSIVKGL